MIVIVDYGLGNLRAFANMLKDIGAAHRVSGRVEDVAAASHLILPGVGHFDRAMNLLAASGLREALDRRVVHDGTPLLGVCVGMQMLADRSEEGELAGLGWIPGSVVRFPASVGNRALAVPHMGWNDVMPEDGAPLFRDLPADPRFYFLHSYHYQCADVGHVMARATYGAPFACAVRHGRIFGVQFHPEKSHTWGRDLLANFAAL